MYNFQQISYDLHENDFASWSWTDLPAQRTRDAALTPPFALGPRLKLGALRGPLRKFAARHAEVGARLHQLKQGLERAWASQETDEALDSKYREEARMRSQEYTGYRHVPACASCDLKAICDGFYGDYSELFGVEEARPILVGGAVDDPQHCTRHQRKRIHPFDADWVPG
jgi:hypothetical protein